MKKKIVLILFCLVITGIYAEDKWDQYVKGGEGYCERKLKECEKRFYEPSGDSCKDYCNYCDVTKAFCE